MNLRIIPCLKLFEGEFSTHCVSDINELKKLYYLNFDIPLLPVNSDVIIHCDIDNCCVGGDLNDYIKFKVVEVLYDNKNPEFILIFLKVEKAQYDEVEVDKFIMHNERFNAFIRSIGKTDIKEV